MILNPSSRASGQLEQTKEGNSSLREKTSKMEEGGGADSHLQRLLQENEAMRQTLKEHDISNKRLMEVFHKKISEFRETVYHLFGYKVDYLEEGYPCSRFVRPMRHPCVL